MLSLNLLSLVIFLVDLVAISLLFFIPNTPVFFKKDPHWKMTMVVFAFLIIWLGILFSAELLQTMKAILSLSETPPMTPSESSPASPPTKVSTISRDQGLFSLSLIVLFSLVLCGGMRYAMGIIFSLVEKLTGSTISVIPPQKVTIMLIGPESVGKTSVLATTYNAVANDHSIKEFIVRPQQDTMRVLSDAYTKLHKVTEQPHFQDLKPLIEGNQVMAERVFDIHLAEELKLTLGFWDIPGGYMKISEKHSEYKKFKEKLQETVIFINVLDAVALIEGDKTYFDERATPEMAKFYLQEPLVVNSKRKVLVLFVVTKCEKWLKTEPGKKELQEKFNSRYADVINLLNANDNMAGVLIPIKTLGCVEFTYFDSTTKRPVFQRKPRIECTPEFVDQPLRYALSFALSQLESDKVVKSESEQKFWKTLQKLKGTRDRHLAIYGNRDLLN